MASRSKVWRWISALALALGAGAAAHAQPGGTVHDAFRACDDQAFLALNMARNYLMTDRNREMVLPHLRDNPAAEAMAQELFDRVDRGEIRHPGQFAADTLFRCAGARQLRVGASRERAALCFTRTDVAFFLHTERERKVVRQQAVSNVLKRLSVRELYPTALVNSVAEAVYRPAEPPDLRRLMGAVAWRCINERPAAAAAASATASAASR